MHIFCRTQLETLSKKKYDYLLKNKEHLSFYKKYTNELHHLRDIYGVKEIENPNNFLFNFINKFNKNKKTILLQGDSRTQAFNAKIVKTLIKNNYNKYNFINGGTTSFSPSLMSVQFDILKRDFNIKPNIIIALIDPTDIGDENCRYKKNTIIKNNKILKVEKEKIPSKIYYLENIILLSEIYNDDSFFKSKYLKKLIQQYKKANNKKTNCLYNDIQKYLIKPNTEGTEYFKKVLKIYLKNISNHKSVEKIILVSYPHIQHLDKNAYNVKYETSISNIIDSLDYSNKKITHLDTYKNNIFENYNKNYFKIFIEGDHASHLTIYGNKIFSSYIFDNIKF